MLDIKRRKLWLWKTLLFLFIQDAVCGRLWLMVPVFAAGEQL